MKQFFIAEVLLICLCGCNERHKKTEFSAKHIVDINQPLEVSLDDVITDIDTIRLEATDESLIKDIYQLQIMDGRIYMSVNNRTMLFIYDLTGKYITQINNRGQGPNDYLTISDFCLDPVHKRIVITDNHSKRILIYDKDGKQIEVIKLNFHPFLIVPFENGYINTNSGKVNYYKNPKMDDYHLSYLDSKGAFIKSALKKENRNTVAISSHCQINILKDGDILFQPPLCYIVYKIHDNNVIPYYEFNNLSKFKLLSDKEYKNFEYIWGMETNTLKEKEDRGYLLTWGGVFETDDFVVFLFYGWDICRLLYYDKKSSKSLFIDPLTLEGDEYAIEFFINNVRTVSDNRIYITPSEYILYKLDGNIKMKDDKVKEFLGNIDEDSNPIILSYKIKFPK